MADILWLGDSYGTGFQPTGGRVDPVPLQVGQLLNLTVDNQSVNASGYVESGDRFSFIQQAQNAALTGERYKYVFVMGGRNDNSDNYSAAMQLFDYIKTTWPEAVVYVAFLWDSRWRMTGVQSNNYSNLNMLTGRPVLLQRHPPQRCGVREVRAVHRAGVPHRHPARGRLRAEPRNHRRHGGRDSHRHP